MYQRLTTAQRQASSHFSFQITVFSMMKIPLKNEHHNKSEVLLIQLQSIDEMLSHQITIKEMHINRDSMVNDKSYPLRMTSMLHVKKILLYKADFSKAFWIM